MYEGTAEEAWELARGLDGPTRAEALEAKILSAGALGTVDDPEAEPELGAGVVVMHLDSEGQHMGVLLRKADGGTWSMVFFTSNATWGVRRASQEELALAGYVTTRRTYLSPVVVRSGGGFIATRKSFPSHRVAALLGEC